MLPNRKHIEHVAAYSKVGEESALAGMILDLSDALQQLVDECNDVGTWRTDPEGWAQALRRAEELLGK